MPPILRTENLGKTYHMGEAIVRALTGLTLKIGAGEMTAIMGPSGSGKSTLMNLLGLLDRPSDGYHWFASRDVGSLDEEERAGFRNRRIGFVFQASNLLPRNTAIENVELPMIYGGLAKAERRPRAEAALTSVGLSQRRDHWPHQLSGGEQQRVAIARALVNNPSLILADEPTGALDARTGLGVLALFQKLNGEGRTIVLVTHDPNVARHADRIAMLQDGHLVADDKVADRRTVAEPTIATFQGDVRDIARAPADQIGPS